MKNKLISLVSLLLCVIIVLSSCSYKPIEPSERDLTVVGQVNGKDVYLEELIFVTYTYRDILTAKYGEDIFDGDEAEKYLEMLKELVYANITSGYAALFLCEENYIGLGEDAILSRVDEKLNEMVTELGGMVKYKKYLKENHLTDHFLRRTVELQLLENELMYIYIDDIHLIENDDEKIYDIIKDEFISVRHIFIPYSDKAAEDNISFAYDRLISGAEFSEVLASYGKDDEMTAEGLIIPRGYMSDEYQSVALELGEGELSEVIKSDMGYYIIQRLSISPASIMLQFDYLKDLYQAYAFYALIDQKQLSLFFTPNEIGEEYMRSPFK